MLQKRFDFSQRNTGPITGWGYFLFALLVLFPTILLGNFLQFSTLLLRPFSFRLFRLANTFVVGCWWGMASRFFGQYTEFVITGDPPPDDSESVIYVANHQQMTDIPIIYRYINSIMKIGAVRWFAKIQLKWTPGIGWGMQLNDCIFLKRNWASDADSVNETFHNIHRLPLPFSIMIFPEGTRITPKKWKRSKEFAAKAKRPMTQMLLMPRTKGFVTTVHNLQDRLDAVYDITIGYPNGIFHIIDLMRGTAPSLHLHARRFDIDRLPADKKGLENFLYDLFQEKDKRLVRFMKTGSLED